ncbi:hypothetical protein [Adhaeribacter rhizoryzae]|uniref:Uncharacterized protein n=1 Tax=Adhaeribacter rhizoryzae TaxID=2607907 RepID=A0A5M6DFU9_9BACT|nr:hypothetical protein [Adhaeribacter rhizoryzae]KAA5546388.1 hypothetical protein F0145_10855 [Adhaeribacter rhizoryzae]
MGEIRNNSAKASDNQLKNIRSESGREAGDSGNLEQVYSQTTNSADLSPQSAATEEISGGEDEPQSVAKEESNNQTMGIP